MVAKEGNIKSLILAILNEAVLDLTRKHGIQLRKQAYNFIVSDDCFLMCETVGLDYNFFRSEAIKKMRYKHEKRKNN